MKKITLLLIEDNRLLREGLVAMLKEQKDITLLGAAEKSENALLKMRRFKPAVVLLDSGLRTLSSLHMIQIVRNEFRNARVIIMDLAPVQGDITQFVKAGAAGFILKDATPDEFLRTIRTVAGGEKVLPDLPSASLFTQIVEQAVKGGRKKVDESLRMTKRERQVLILVGEGLSNKEIGGQLRISTHTIKSHVRNIMEKLALHTRLEMANFSFAVEKRGRTNGKRVISKN